MATETQAPVRQGDDKKLFLLQVGHPEARPGGEPTRLNFAVLSTVKEPVNPGDVTYTLKAPTGFLFSGWIGWAYHDANTMQPTSNAEAIEPAVSDGGRTLTFTHKPCLRSNAECLGYGVDTTAVDGTDPDTYQDGRLEIGDANPINLTGTVLGPDED
ncbi:hypothetical protein B7767_43905 [Streptomyces sp. 13-12-16]|uniref:hypothetical protein n=1 Tax=Streptomyces sp. 13-12-16 TaxID=1570823 RepID=UPI000A1F76C2|nr:hypothetical protein [Streptomyces sp. 13-12-16]OSP23510.1 hypothetical protein B7767_43905 [Streptomyces sp. 13-12-16]